MKRKQSMLRKYKRTNVYPFLSKMYYLLRNKPEIFVLKKMKMCLGLCDWEEDTISIDYRKEFIAVLIHEVLHYVHPSWSETKVLKEESKILNALSVRQVKNILKRFAQFL